MFDSLSHNYQIANKSEQEVVGSIPGHNRPKSLKLVVLAFPLGAQDYPFPKRQISDSSKLKGFADDNFEFNENGEKFSKRVKNIVRKGEIARYIACYEQFLLFPLYFRKTSTTDT